MFSFILLILFFVILWPLITAGWKVWRNIHRIRRFMADPEGEMRREAERAARNNGAGATRNRWSSTSTRSRTTRRRGKKIGRDVGEYVAFTDIELSEEELRRRDSSRPVSFKKEEQITDIKWEDV